MKYIILFVGSFILFFSCKQESSKNYEAELLSLKKELLASKNEINDLKESNKKPLVHVVFLKAKDNISELEKDTLFTALKSLKNQIPYIIDYQVGIPADTGDSRLISDYDYVLYMGFKDLDALRKYQKNKFHLSVREQIKKYLAKVPVVYDFYEQ